MQELKLKTGYTVKLANGRFCKKFGALLISQTIYLTEDQMKFVAERCMNNYGKQRRYWSEYIRGLVNKEMKEKLKGYAQ